MHRHRHPPVLTPTRRSPRVPQELSEIIIDILGENYRRAELNACSTVCHAWLPRCRSYIHSAIRLDYSSNFERLSQLYTSSSLAGYVKSLCIDVCEESGEPAELHPWVNTAPVLPLLRALENVERLSLEGVSWPQMEEETVKVIFGYKRVKDLWLATCDFPDPRDLVRVLQAYLALESARMEGVCADDDDITKVLENNPEKLELTWLDVGDLCSRPDVVVKWATRNRTSVSIENIHISWGCEDPADLRQLLKLAGSSVKKLSITMDERAQGSSETFPGDMLLSSSDGLRNFRLLVRSEKYDDTSPQHHLDWVSDCIAQLSSSHLSVVRIHLEVKEFDQVNHVNWTQIDETLAQKNTLEKVEVCIFKRWDCVGKENTAMLNLVKAAMPKLQSQTRLDVMQQWT